MSIIEKVPYEISIWDDVLTYNITYTAGVNNGQTINVTKLPVLAPDNDEAYIINYQFFDEQKVAVIGADKMDAQTRAHSPILTRNVNGTVALSFVLYNHIYDYETGEYRDNPFIKLLTNERKIKLRYDEVGVADPWHDLIIKNIQESSDNKTYTYTAASLPVNELSKNGYNIELDNELMNNQGTITELATKVLEGSDWQLDSESTDLLRQWIEEPLYETVVKTSIIGINPLTKDEVTIVKGEKVYLFYSYVAETKTDKVQFILPEALTKIDGNNVITEPDIYVLQTEFTWGKDGIGHNLPSFASQITFYNNARAQRLEYRPKSIYDEVAGRFVYVYKDAKGDKYYGYSDTEYISPSYVRNFITNAKNFSSTAGWGYLTPAGAANDASVQIKYDPDIGTAGWAQNAKPYLRVDLSNTTWITNQGLFDSKTYLSAIAEGEKYVLQIAVKKGEESKLDNLEFIIRRNIEAASDNGPYVTFTKDTNISTDGYVSYSGTWNRALSANDINMLAPTFCFRSTSNTPPTIDFAEIRLFKYIEIDGQMVAPGTITGKDTIIQTHYYMYKAGAADTAENIKYVYQGLAPATGYTPVYNDGNNFEKIRSIVGKESNRYNLLQSLSESFECWPKFTVEHDKDTGRVKTEKIVVEDSINKEKYTTIRQKKFVSFHKFVGKENHAGFRYGINLKSIQRTLDSNQLASKVVVSSNSNELGKDGFCTISRAEENPTLENFILCFDYYVQHGLLSQEIITNDLYDGSLTAQKYIGYYPNLLKLNKERDVLIERNAALTKDKSNVEAEVQTLTLAISEAEQSAASYEANLKLNSGYTYQEFLDDKVSNTAKENTENQNSVISITYFKNTAAAARNNLTAQETALNTVTTEQSNIEEKLKKIAEQKEELNKRFYTKYARYIQEGTWISEDYIDDNLYYLDAYNVARTSAFPKVTYSINVLGLEGNPELKGYSFNVGDISYIEDTEFFGYKYIDGLKTPYHEEVVVSERVDNLDSPEENQIRVQNYKTQFEDLFQRIEATSQAVEYGTGAISKVTNIVNTDSTIKTNILQSSLFNNSLIIQNAKDQSVTWGDQGITITNLGRPNEIVRLVSSGILLSNDGGSTWNLGVTANGINANYLTSGRIDTSEILIANGAFPAFRWDSSGLNAYKNDSNGYNYNSFIRFDQYGLYGIFQDAETPFKFADDATWSERLAAIQDAAQFSVTWNGFRLRGNGTNKYLDISAANDLRIVTRQDGVEIDRLKIGLIDSYNDVYGLQIRNSENQVVLTTDEDGELWLQSALHVGGSSEQYDIKIGYNESKFKIEDEEQIHESINVNDNFVVYEDGSMVANSATIKGHIEATSGKIGNMTIGEIESIADGQRKLEIISTAGNTFKVSHTGAAPEMIKLTAKETGLTELDKDTIYWFTSTDLISWTPIAQGIECQISYTTFSNKQKDDILYLKIEAIFENVAYDDFFTINQVKDGEDPVVLVITASHGTFFRNNIGSTILTAKLYQRGAEIDMYEPYDYEYKWYDASNPTEILYNTKSIQITADDVSFSRTYGCDIELKGG